MTVVLKNPGIVTYYPQDPKNEAACPECNTSGSYMEHCDRCNVCYDSIDHHCPWTSKCVARGNIVAFWGFLASMFGSMIYAFFMLLLQSNT